MKKILQKITKFSLVPAVTVCGTIIMILGCKIISEASDPKVLVKAGDKVKVTFVVQARESGILNIPHFTAALASYGTIWGWQVDPPTLSSNEYYRVEVTGYGEYSLEGIATQDTDSDTNTLLVDTDLKGYLWIIQ